MNFKKYLENKPLNEKINNLFNNDDKDLHKNEIFTLLQKSYASLGGIKGSGFNSPDDMKSIKMWKTAKVQGKLVAGLLYKDKNMRKTVAVFTDGSRDGKRILEKMLRDDFNRSVIEVSHSLLHFIEKKMPSLVKKYAVDTKYVQGILKKNIEVVDQYHYMRGIGNEMITKMMLGNIKKFQEL